MCVPLLPIHASAQFGLRVPPPPKTVTLFEPEIYGLERLAVDSTLFRKRPTAYKRSVVMDSTASFVSFRESLDGSEFYLPAVIDLDTYIRLRREFDARELWKKSVVTGVKPGAEKSFGAISLDIPIGIKSKTFQRIFGSDKIGLRVTGNISFDLSGRTEKRSGSAISALENQNTFSPRFKQTQQFTVEGKIGDKVTVSVEQNSEAQSEIENTLKLHYDGGEDEIVQKIEAGNIALSLPSTKYVIFGGSNKGLFGLKSQMQLGDLHFTAIASLEKGQQQELNISGSSKESKTTIKDTDFIKNRYFFADKSYRDQFEKGLEDDPQTFSYIGGTEIYQLEVWQSATPGEPGTREGIADIDPFKYLDANYEYKNIDIDTVDTRSREDIIAKAYFKKLDPSQYTVDKYRGFFMLNQSVDDNRILAIAYATAQAVNDPTVPSVGTLNEALTDTLQPVVLKLIKPRQMTSTYSNTWPLMLRNVYSLGGSNIELDGFDVRLENNVNGTHERSPEGSARTYLNLLDLDVLNENGELIENGDEKMDNNPYIINRAEGTLMFPCLQPFNPEPGSRFYGRLPEKDRVNVYNLSNVNNSAFLDSSKFEMIVTSRSTKSTFDLGFYVLEGSEVVTLGGQTLVRDKDYLIDYFSGQLTLLSSEAKRSSSNISIKYERANLFQLDKKTIFGGRMEYKLSDESFVGLTALYLNKSTLDQRVRVGQEPFSNFIWDVNAAFKFKPRFLTKMADALPFVETNNESRFDIEGEFAQVLPDPNTLNSEGTGDKDGVAYIDDFESSKRTTTLGINYRTWSPASAPVEFSRLGTVNDLEADRSRANLAWFNPYSQVAIKEIWPNRDVNSQTGTQTIVLGLDMWRDKNSDPDSAWVGVMRSTTSFADQQKTKYIEMWIKGTKGTVHIDVGKISEDYYIRGKNVFGQSSRGGLNTEDRNLNGLLEGDEDVGVDGIPNGQPGDDPFDDWNTQQADALNFGDRYNYDYINGTEGNSRSREAHYPDTEDLDGDGQVSVTNDYFEYTFSLDSSDAETKKWIVGSTPYGWRQFRIPLKDFTHPPIGNPDPDFQQILNVRMWFSDLDTVRSRIFIATFDFVGNEWEETGIANGSDKEKKFIKNDSLFTLATYNSEENAQTTGRGEGYSSPPGVRGVRDRITQALSKEQSLAMIFNDFKAGQIAEAKKTLFNPIDLINYKKLRMFLHGPTDGSLPDRPPLVTDQGDTATDKSSLRFYLRFGSDAKNYYEYGQDIYAGWNMANKIDIDLDEMAAIKSVDSLMRADSLGFEKKLADVPDGYYRAVGAPSLRTIRYFIIGVEHRGAEIGRNPADFTGDIWLDELRLSEVRKENATAMRVSANLQLADLLSFNAQWESTDAGFHNISTQFGEGSTEERQNYSGKLNVDKFLPNSWDLSVPVDARASFSRSIPKYKPKTDELTGYRNNTFDRKLKSLLGLRETPKDLEDQISVSEVFGWGTTIKKRSKSKAWYLRYTLDELLFDFDYSYRNSSNWETRYNKSEQYKESMRYKIPFSKNNFVEPFKFLKKTPVLGALSDQKFYYTPDQIDFSLDINDSESKQQRRNSAGITRLVTTGASRSVSSSYKFMPSLTFNYSRNIQSDADFDSLSHAQLIRNIFTKFNFGLDTDVGQSFSGSFRPTLVSWLQADFGYNNNFNYQLTNGNKYKQTGSKSSKSIGFTLNPGALVKSIYTPKKKTETPKQKSGVHSPGKSKNEDEPQTQDQDKKEDPKKKTIEFPNPLMLIYNVLSDWKSVRSKVSLNDQIAHKYLKGMPGLGYQFGFTKNPGVSQDSSLQVNLTGPLQSQSMAISTSTSFNLSQNITTSLTHDYSKSESRSDYGKTRTGNKSTTYFALGDDPMKSYKGLSGWRAFMPDWSVQVSGVEKWLFFPQFAQSITLDHGHASKYSENLSLKLDGSFLPTSQNFSNNWQPLVGANIRTKWGVSAQMRMTGSTTFSYASGAGATKTETEAFTVSLTYSKTSGFSIPVWPFAGKTFKNEINFNLTFDSSNNKSFQKQFQDKNFQEKQNNSSWKLRPSATYRFSQKVQGSLFYETGASQNKISGKYSYNEFGLTVNIAIRD